MNRALTGALLIAAGATVAVIVLGRAGVGRSLWYPRYAALRGNRTHAEVLSALGPARRSELAKAFAARGLSYPPQQLTLIGLKEEREMEAWAARGDGTWALVRTYPLLAASGSAGPKLREGDRQVPEGQYALTGFNPNSSYHLSLRVGYPSSDDQAIAHAEGRTALGGDIFIHGKAVSIGCLAIGDAAIEDLYVLVADTGLDRVTLLLSPDRSPVASARAPAWLRERYRLLSRELATVRGGLTREQGP